MMPARNSLCLCLRQWQGYNALHHPDQITATDTMTIHGRIDIHFPDGRSETHRLEHDAFTIGSAAGNTRQIADAALAPRHLRFSYSLDAFFLTNLAAGYRTTLDDLPLPLDEPLRLHDVASIQAGELRIIFNQSSDYPTVAMNAISEATQPTAAGFRVELEAGALQVWQYSSASIALSVTNTSDRDGLFRLGVSGRLKDWTTPDALVFSVAGNDAVEILLQVKPTRGLDLAPGEYPLTIDIRRLDGDEGAALLVLLVRLGAVGGLSAALDPPRQPAGDPFSLRLRNLGNSPLSLRLRPQQSGERLNITLAQEAIRLDAGERAVVSGIAELRRRPLFGQPADASFAVLAEAREPNNYVVALPASVSVNPLLGPRALFAAALAIAILALAAAALLFQPPQPLITSFASSESLVARGTPVELTWSAEQSQRFAVEVNRAPLSELPGDAARYTLDTRDYPDPIDIVLIARNGDAVDRKSLRLEIYQPVNVIQFEPDKWTLPRDMPSQLTIRWRVAGAAKLGIALPTAFERLRETIADNEGELVIQGKSAEDFQITLNAEDETGAKTMRELTITVHDPECAPIQDTVLYAGPDSRYEHAGFALGNVPVLATGVNAAGDWLQVELANGDRGWAFHTHFRCHGFAPDNLKIITNIPPLPTQTPPPNPTETPTVIATLSASPTPDSSALTNAES